MALTDSVLPMTDTVGAIAETIGTVTVVISLQSTYSDGSVGRLDAEERRADRVKMLVFFCVG